MTESRFEVCGCFDCNINIWLDWLLFIFDWI